MTDIRTRPVSITHLVFGLIFLGAAGLWAIGAATDADTPDLAVLAPAVLVAAGVVGLIAMVINARNARVHHPSTTSEDPEPDRADNDTVVIDGEDHR
jgi:hypothetical protein